MIMEVSRIVVLLLASGALVGSALAAPPMPGGRQDSSVTNQWVVAAANFAVQAQQQALQKEAQGAAVSLALVTLVKAAEQVVAGMNYYLTLSVTLNGAPRTAEAVVYRRFNGDQKLTSWTWK